MTTQTLAEKREGNYVLRLEGEGDSLFLSKLYLVIEGREILILENTVFALAPAEAEIEEHWKFIKEAMIPAPHNLLMDWSMELDFVRENGTEEDKDNVLESIALQIRTFVQGNL